MKVKTDAYYAGMNKRFDKRIEFMRRFGFRSEINEYGHFLVRKRSFLNKPDVVQAGVALLATNTVWINILKEVLT